MYFLILIKSFAHTLNIFANNYLTSILNRIQNTLQYSIINQAGVLH